MEVQNSRSRSHATAGLLLLVAAVQYLALEAVAAAAWRHPRYSYAVNFISDLGNPVPGDVFQGRTIDSPLHLLMDLAFLTQGALFIAATALVYRSLEGRKAKAVLVLALIHGIGVGMVGLFPESAAALTNGVIIAHSVGAIGAIVGGNVLLLVSAAGDRQLGAPTWHKALGITLGVIGLAAFALLQADHTLYVAAGGVPERIAVYTIVAWEAVTGVSLLRAATTSAVLGTKDGISTA
ncbi:DUF998 domain-containing protein [Streptomyces sp. NPDC048297]|uniref:DUF998 domain-containing protein n=1 Tax=Streptomyces sp. NPDC048297 TaxID=3365531 RepID=UPI003710E42F